MTTKRNVLVTGATGQQGGAVARALLSSGHRVKALTRKPDSDGARQLASVGAEIVAGDLGDTASVVKAAKDVDTMFLMGNSYEAGMEEETRQGILAADAAKAAGVGHLIYSSVADANKKTGIPHFESKYLVEQHVERLGISLYDQRPGCLHGEFRRAVVDRRAQPGHACLCNARQSCPPAGRTCRHRRLRCRLGRATRARVWQALRYCGRRVVRRRPGQDPFAVHRPPDQLSGNSNRGGPPTKRKIQR